MSRPIVILRPEPGCSETLSAARGLAMAAIAAPLFAIEPVLWNLPDPANFDALLVGSANVFRHGGAGLSALTGLPVMAVGDRTGEAARDAKFRVRRIGQGGLQALLDTVEGPTRLLRLAGEARVELYPPAGVSVTDLTVYRAVALPLAQQAVEVLSYGATVLLHSGEAVRHFAGECDRLSLDRSMIAVAALAPRIAEAAGHGWRAVRTAAETTDAALLALADDMCH